MITRMAKMTFDFDGLISLLAQNLYSEKKVFIRELVQNGHDSIMRLRARLRDFAGRIDIFASPQNDTIVFRDNGLGMNKADLVDFLSNVGKSGTKQDHGNVAGLIGQFGIGFLSGFLVADRIEVRTKNYDESQAWLWTNEGTSDYEIVPCNVDFDHGAEVQIKLKSVEHRGLIHSEEVKQVVRQYADMLTVEIHVDGVGPVNTMNMPWEKRGISEDERKLECFLYVEKTMHGGLLEAIPVALTRHEHGVDAAGVLYITKMRVFAIDAPRNVRVFQKRMFLCENAPDVLPKWASFVNGVLDAPSLTPNAARDSFIRNADSDRLTEVLGAVVISHLEALQKEDPERFGEILRYHELSIKGACFYHEDFRRKFIRHLPWRTNSGKMEDDVEKSILWRTLPEILGLLPAPPPGELQVLPCFTTHSSANQYFQMASAAGQIVVDASNVFEGELLEKYTLMDGARVRLLHVDRVDDPKVFRMPVTEDAAVERLGRAMAECIVVGRAGSKLRVEARRFDPPELEAIIRTTERTKGVLKAEAMLSDPNSPEDLREMARDLVQRTRRESLKLTINASNPFIRALALIDPRDEAFLDLALGIYNNAILYNAELMTSENAKIFHDHFGRLLARTLASVNNRADLERARSELEREKAAAVQAPRLGHRVFFLMTPFDRARYGTIHDALRIAVEDHWHCQLFLASDRTYDQRLLDNVRIHMEQADAFLAEITAANSNVLFELGAVFERLRGRPVVLLRSKDTPEDQRPKLPADLQGLLYVEYDPSLPATGLAAFLETELRKTASVDRLVKDPERERFISMRTAKQRVRVPLSERSLTGLVERFPTLEAWARASERDVASHLDVGDRDLAGVVLGRMQAST